jgi:hypothetical protein
MKRIILALFFIAILLIDIAYAQEAIPNTGTIFRGTIAKIEVEQTHPFGGIGSDSNIIVLTLVDYPKKKFIVDQEMASELKIGEYTEHPKSKYMVFFVDGKKFAGKKAKVSCKLKQTIRDETKAVKMEFYNVISLEIN